MLHILKLCVGTESIRDLAAWQAERMAERLAAGQEALPRHVTRMWPKRAAEIAGKGSLYWVIRGVIRVRQPILRLDRARGEDGVERCALILDPALIPVEPRPRAAFQGWRYLPAAEAPPDLARAGSTDADLPASLIQALDSLGVRARAA
jgi:hypothetical protein